MSVKISPLVIAMIVTALLLAVAYRSSSADPNRPSRTRLEASIAGYAPVKLRFKLATAYQLARRRLQDRSECRELFHLYDHEGLEVIDRSTYSVAQSPAELSICSYRSAAAYTKVGGMRTSLCPSRFEDLNVQKAAVILIHESLHQAGMMEWPHDPTGLRSLEINNLIRERCSL